MLGTIIVGVDNKIGTHQDPQTASSVTSLVKVHTDSKIEGTVLMTHAECIRVHYPRRNVFLVRKTIDTGVNVIDGSSCICSFLKISILCLYLRMTPEKSHHLTIYIFIGIVAAHSIATVLVRSSFTSRVNRLTAFAGQYLPVYSDCGFLEHPESF